MGADLVGRSVPYLLEATATNATAFRHDRSAFGTLSRFRSDGVAGTGRGSGLLSAFENGRKIYVGTDWNGLSGTSGIQGIY